VGKFEIHEYEIDLIEALLVSECKMKKVKNLSEFFNQIDLASLRKYQVDRSIF
jgi:hypothetical protein